MVVPGTDVLVTGVGVSVELIMVGVITVGVSGSGDESRVGKNGSVGTGCVALNPVGLGPVPVISGVGVMERS
jgi:hypothetical protein